MPMNRLNLLNRQISHYQEVKKSRLTNIKLSKFDYIWILFRKSPVRAIYLHYLVLQY